MKKGQGNFDQKGNNFLKEAKDMLELKYYVVLELIACIKIHNSGEEWK